MILSKVGIHGFKSFAKKLELRFDGRITAIVGPNGCGKTNIVDAIRWGLGEQRTSVLRADRMENMIFGGAQSSRPLGMAEVSIHFDNSDHLLPIDYSEVVVTRRLYRSGESEYLLNKSSVRLKDINDLLMDTGIGADAYSVIELKMVEDILSEKAEDRRKLLEEAAGVTKYKHRLKAAMRKLDATRNDLLRVNDIIQEVERSVNSLKRQVQRARRYQTLHEEVKQLELACGKHMLTQLRQKAAPLREELKSLQQMKDGRTSEITKEEAEIETFRLQLAEKEKALIEAREELAGITERIHQRESDVRVAKERVSSLKERIQQHTEEIESLKKRLEDQKTHLGVAEGQRESLQVKITSTGRIFKNKQKELEVFQQGLNLKRLELNEKKKEIITCLEEINRLGGEETDLRARIDSNRGRLARLDEEDALYQADLKSGQEALKDAQEKLQTLANERQRLDREKKKLQEEAEGLKKRIEESREKYYKDQSELELLKGRLSFLRSVVENREGVADGAKMLLQEKVPGLMGALADSIDTAEEHRDAIEAGLGETAQYLLFEKTSHAFEAISLLKKRGGGKASAICLDRIESAKSQQSRPSLPKKLKCVGWGDELVSCDKKIKPVISQLLGDLLVVEDFEVAQQALDLLPEEPVRIASLQGDIITAWGVSQIRSSSEEDVGLLGRKQRIQELDSRIQEDGKRLEKEKQTIKNNEERLGALEGEITEAGGRLKGADTKFLDLEKKKAQFDYEVQRAEKGLEKNRSERQALLNAIEKEGEDLENLRPRMDALTEKREQVERVSAQIGGEVDRLEEEERVKEEDVHRLNLQVVRLNGEAKTLDSDIERSKGLVEDIQGTIDQRHLEIEKANQEIVRLTTETQKNEEALVKDFSERDDKESSMEAREADYQKLQEDLRIKEKEVRDVRRDRDAAAEKTHQMEMDIAEIEHQEQVLKGRILESYEVDLEKVDEKEDVDIDNAEEEIEDLKRKMKNLGPVNLVALDEYDQEKERLDFLNRQREDLLSAEDTLKETIQRINQTARQRFGEVFTKVRENFKETFCRFFKGGEADLRLPEDEDPLEAQIEIIARPAGKHFRDLSLLSGGERALTAISLLFALYLVKPSPFCILDEIDAPLDDANVERFTNVLGEYAEKTQFIIVTHNKMTMRVAKALYGVTMEEEGVSRVVSVKFDENGKSSSN